MEKLDIMNASKRLDVKNACIDQSRFVCVGAERLYFENVSLAGTKITDANMSDLEIDGAQLGGAFIHNIGLPPEGHPAYTPGAEQRPLRFESCDLRGSRIERCDLSRVEIADCELSGMTINGIPVEELLKSYFEK
ncbi:pentapeptide repeat-containing protein [Paenibacillus piri]|nr:pentapeptide repeat-containing protein [Paenibacillus piri]